jgi:3-hydroxyacyl-CoA dehydrogenase/enoyl-CoA hydratase/3-hydroxybutyryl-CoA epimerase
MSATRPNVKSIGVEVDDEGIATLTIDVEGRSMNVITPAFLDELERVVERISGDGEIRGVIVTSGKDAFMAGADLIGLVEAFDQRQDLDATIEECRKLQAALRRLETCGKPVAAAINGTALGGGLEICLACHYRVAADRSDMVLGLPEVQVGLLPGGGGTQRLPRLIGIERALQLITQGRHVSAAEALELGIVHAVAVPGEVLNTARNWLVESGDAEQPWDRKGFRFPGGAGLTNPSVIQTQMVGTALLQKTTNHHYPAPIAIMSAVYEGGVLPMDRALEIETRYFVSLLSTPVSRNKMRTLFVNKGAADKLVRRPKGPPKRDVKKLGVLGAGMMGAGIAYVSARAGMHVVLLDTSADKAEQGKDYSRELLRKRVERGKTTNEEAETLLSRIETTTSAEILAGADLVIEAVFEDRGIKAQVTQAAEPQLAADGVFASNTSTLPITGLATASRHPERFIGIHFFSPVDRMPLVEIIRGRETGVEAVAAALDYVRQLGKTPIVVNDSRGFYTSRVFGTFSREGIIMLAEGLNPALIENAAKHAGMPVGPLAVTDEVSLELSWHVMKQAMADLGDDYMASPADEVVRLFVEKLQRPGKRARRGFYEYPDDGRKYLWPGLAQHFPRTEPQPSPREVRDRLLYIQAIESVRCLDEKVVEFAADADIGSVFGWGFPAWTGGTVSFIEWVGLQRFVDRADRLAGLYGARFEVPDSLRSMAEDKRGFYRNAA